MGGDRKQVGTTGAAPSVNASKKNARLVKQLQKKHHGDAGGKKRRRFRVNDLPCEVGGLVLDFAFGKHRLNLVCKRWYFWLEAQHHAAFSSGKGCYGVLQNLCKEKLVKGLSNPGSSTVSPVVENSGEGVRPSVLVLTESMCSSNEDLFEKQPETPASCKVLLEKLAEQQENGKVAVTGCLLRAYCHNRFRFPDKTIHPFISSSQLKFAKEEADKVGELVRWSVKELGLADLRPQPTDSAGRTLLHLASTYGDAVTVKHLLQHNADITVRDRRGHTPLHSAAERSALEVAQLLLGRGQAAVAVCLKTKDASGRTPLELAARNNLNTLTQAISRRQKQLLQVRSAGSSASLDEEEEEEEEEEETSQKKQKQKQKQNPKQQAPPQHHRGQRCAREAYFDAADETAFSYADRYDW